MCTLSLWTNTIHRRPGPPGQDGHSRRERSPIRGRRYRGGENTGAAPAVVVADHFAAVLRWQNGLV